MTDRASAIATFVDAAGWGGAKVQPLAGDASARAYLRLHLADRTAVLMDAPPDRCGPVAPFLTMSAHLALAGLSAPRVLAADGPRGLVLLEDLGDNDLHRAISLGLAPEQTLYVTALDALRAMQAAAPPPGLLTWDAAHMADVVRPAFEEGPGGAPAFDRWHAALVTAFAPLDQTAPVLCHRDFHAWNLFWLPARSGPARIGIIDHQDAFVGHPAYDLVSLMTDARRDLAAGLPDVLIRHWLDQTDTPAKDLHRDMALLSVQRNLRVHGVLTRLVRSGRTGYAAFLPRVRGHLSRALQAVPGLLPMAQDVMP